MGPRAGLDTCGKSRPHRDSIPGRGTRKKYYSLLLVLYEWSVLVTEGNIVVPGAATMNYKWAPIVESVIQVSEWS